MRLFSSVCEVHVSYHMPSCIHMLLSGGFQGTLSFRQGPPAPSPALWSCWLSRQRALPIPPARSAAAALCSIPWGWSSTA